MPRINIICALAENRAIGKDNKLLWHIPDDLKHFKELTTNHPIIMGVNTYNSIGKPLPNRTNIVLTSKDLEIPECCIAHSMGDAINMASEIEKDEIFIIGGGKVYADAIKSAERLYLTIVDGEYEADTYFPDYSEFNNTLSEEIFETDKYKYKFVTLERDK